MDVDATAFAFGACRCSNPVALALALVLLRRLFFLSFSSAASSSVGIASGGYLPLEKKIELPSFELAIDRDAS